jgi:membrane dipeptidase
MKHHRISLPSLALASVAVLGVASGCSHSEVPGETASPRAAESSTEEPVAEKAQRLAQEMVLVDTHVDVPYRLEEAMEDISVRTEKGDFDFVRAREGGLNAPFMSIYIPAEYQETGGAKEFADSLIDMVERLEKDHPSKFVITRTVDEILSAKAAGKIAFPMGMENGAPVEDDLANLAHFFDRGVRYITLTHSKNNQICDSSYEPKDNRKWGGLSPFGEQVVAEMNRLGIMVDISHVSDEAFYDVLKVTEAPVIASHSSARHFTPGFERNMDDDMIRALAENGGVIQINFGSSFVTREANDQGMAVWAHLTEYAATNNLKPDSEALVTYTEQYRKEHPTLFAKLSDVVGHIDHVVKLVGIDHVGLGSDFDGVGDSLPEGLKDVSQYPNLIAALLESGYSEEDIGKVLSGNIFRVWNRVAAVATELRGPQS